MDPNAPPLRSTARYLAALVMFAAPLLGAIQETSTPKGDDPSSVASELVEDALNHDLQLLHPPTPNGAAGQQLTARKPSPFWFVVFALAALLLVVLQRLEAREDPLLGRLRRKGSGLTHRDEEVGAERRVRNATSERQGSVPRERRRDPPVVPLPPHIIAHLQRGKARPTAEVDERAPVKEGPDPPSESPSGPPIGDHSTGGPGKGGWEIVLPAYKPWSSDDPR